MSGEHSENPGTDTQSTLPRPRTLPAIRRNLDCLHERCLTADAADRDRHARVESIWGTEPAYIRQAEDRAGWLLGFFFYQWIGDLMYRAAAENLTAAQLPQPTAMYRSTTAGRALSRALTAQQDRRRLWDYLVGYVRVRTRHRGGDGVLRYIGSVLQYRQDRGRNLYAGVAWDEAPRPLRPWLGCGGSATEGPGVLHDGTVDGEHLFDLSEGEALGSCERIADVEVHLGLLDSSAHFEDDRRAFLLMERELTARCTVVPRSISLLRALLSAVGWRLFLPFPFRFLKDVCVFCFPVILQLLIESLESGAAGASWRRSAVLVLVLFALQTTECGVSNKYVHLMNRSCLLVKNSIISILFEKCLTMSAKSLAEPNRSAGNLINFMSGDVDGIANLLYVLWSALAPLQLVFGIFLLYRLVDYAAFVGVGIMVLFLPVQGLIMGGMFSSYRAKARATDARLQATNEFFAGIRVAKFMSWEPSFIIRIEAKRRAEVAQLRRIRFFIMLITFFMNAAPSIVMASIFAIYVQAGHELTPSVVFPAMSVLGILEQPFMMIPMAAQTLTRSMVSARRLNKFLDAEDMCNAEALLHPFSNPEDTRDVECWDQVAAVFSNARITAYMGHKLPLPSVFRAQAADAAPTTEYTESSAVGQSTTTPTESPPGNSPTTRAPPNIPGGAEEDVYELRPKHLLQDVTLRIPRGGLTVIVGPTGSGKSSLLDALIGAVEVSAGRVSVDPSIAYVPQQPWIMNATLRENVLFFSDMNEVQFERALSSTQLQRDLKLLSDGVETEIGERGINLSGGQKARVSLARAVYADKELYLLDDPLSALDAEVGELVMQACILGTLSRKTRILATHHLDVLPRADCVVAVDEGRVVFQGTFEAYRLSTRQSVPISSPQRSPAPAECAGEDADIDPPAAAHHGTIESALAGEGREEGMAGSAMEHNTDAGCAKGEGPAKASGTMSAATTAAGRLTTDEEISTGAVGFEMYRRYAAACGGWSVCGCIGLIYVFTECAFVAPSLWLTIWSTNSWHLTTSVYLRVYIVLTSLDTLCSPLRYWTTTSVMLRAGIHLHSQLIRSVATATLTFYDTTPLGRILNRFSKDIERLDGDLLGDYLMLFSSLSSLVSSTVIMLSTQFFVLLILFPMALVYRRLMRFYNAANRHLQRIANVSHSPIFTALSEVMTGRWSIHAYGKSHAVMRKTLQLLDTVYAASYVNNVGDRWLSVRIEFMTALIVASVAAFAVLSMHVPLIPLHVGLVALSLTMAMKMSWTLKNVIMQVASVEADMTSVQRVAAYIDDIPHEEGTLASIEAEIREHGQMRNIRSQTLAAPADSVPEADERDPLLSSHASALLHGGESTTVVPMTSTIETRTIEFRDVNMRYREGLPLVLRGVSFAVAAGQKVGVVGRTGSGKSSLLLAFLRFVEVCGGEMIVGGRPATSYGLRELRQLFSMIPQDPLLFDGTVRSNVDPFGESSDDDVWSALQQVGMYDRVREETGCLDGRVSEGGANFSVGQRQLLCLARALLKRGSAFLLMDEATANVDPALDLAIQETVQRTFRDYTVITIAHRLHTVAGYDMILMLEAGRVVAYGPPGELVRDAASPFAHLVRSMGEEAHQTFMDNIRAA